MRRTNAIRQTVATGLALLGLLFALGLLTKCTPAPSPASKDPACEPEVYGAGLTACTAISTTLRDSVACENYWRLRCGRPPRVLPSDAGARS